MESQIVSWLEEISNFEDASTQIVDEYVSDSDRSSHHSEHNTETEQSAKRDASNKKVSSPIVCLPKYHLFDAKGHPFQI
ncbi:unnamed protein product [Parnassius apollo]|uniref:(apollo) hypothetical protein n=1 Tax=Parnassius apollo TaxID=110799 RepID=A0A8S3XHW7_PARAO|nr:unnamed protein product [Parnassius apollo]